MNKIRKSQHFHPENSKGLGLTRAFAFLGEIFDVLDLPQIHTIGFWCQDIDRSALRFILSHSKAEMWLGSVQNLYILLITNLKPQISALECGIQTKHTLLSISTSVTNRVTLRKIGVSQHFHRKKLLCFLLYFTQWNIWCSSIFSKFIHWVSGSEAHL